jgi:hypothetical protein
MLNTSAIKIFPDYLLHHENFLLILKNYKANPAYYFNFLKKLITWTQLQTALTGSKYR